MPVVWNALVVVEGIRCILLNCRDLCCWFDAGMIAGKEVSEAEEEARSVVLYWPDWSLSDQTDRSIRMPKVRILVRRLPRVIPSSLAACN